MRYFQIKNIKNFLEQSLAMSDKKGPPSSTTVPKKAEKPEKASKKQPEIPPKDKPTEPDLEESTGASSIENLRKFFADTLGFSDKGDEEKVRILNSNDLDGIVDYIKAKKCKNIITMAGAGISTSAGIPDFRSPESGLYHNLQKYNLPHPQAIFELDFFNENPKPFFTLAKELYPGAFEPTVCHYFIKLLLKKGLLLRHYTQNIDTLERVAGIPEEKIVEAHGTFYTGHCLKCRKVYDLEWMKERIFRDEIPECLEKKCKGVVKPDIVFFGEALPMKFYNFAEKDFKKCDLLIILGSSLVVEPFGSLVDKVPETCPRLLVNREKVRSKAGLMSMMLGFGSGLDFDSKDNSRDVAWLGDCDDGCLLLAEKMGWQEELKNLRETELDKIKAKQEEEKKEKKAAA